MANLKELFPEFYQTNLNVSDLSSQTDNLIVLDTNYLLDIIQLPTTVSKKYIEALEKVKDSIYIPYLVALEFNFKKSSIKKDKIKKIKKYKDAVEQSVLKVNESIKTIDLVDDSEKEDFTKEILELTEDYSKKLTSLIEKKIVSIITKEEAELYERLIQIIEEKIGDKYEQEWITKVEEEGKARYEKKIPPGFNDASKAEEEESVRRYGDIEYQRKYGDLLIWKDIIKHSKECGNLGKKVIFITNDGKSKEKADLLYKVDNLIVGPSIHLMNELQMESEKEFHILNNLRFIQLVNDLSDAEVNKLKTSSEQLYRVKIPYNQIKEEMKHIMELNSKNDEFEFGIDSEGYLTRTEKKEIDRKFDMEKRAKEVLLRQLRNRRMHEQNKEEIIDNILLKKLIESNDHKELDQQIDFFDKYIDVDKIRYDKEFREKFLEFYKSDEDKYLDEDID